MLIYSEHFDARASVTVYAGIAGDWRKISARGNVTLSVQDAHLLLQVSADGGKNWVTTGIKTHIDQFAQPAGPNSGSVTSSWAGFVSAGAANTTKAADFEYDLPNPNSGGPDKTFRAWAGAVNSLSNFYTNRVDGYFPCQAINAIRLVPSTGTISGWLEVIGYREVDAFPANDVFRVACSGASLTSSGGWTFPVQNKLQEKTPTRRVVVRNFGNPGAWGTSEIALLNLGNIIACKPDVAILDHSAADSAYSVAGVSAWGLTCQMIDRLRDAGIEPMLLTTNPISGGGFPNLTAYYQQYREIGLAKSCRVIDCYPLWVAQGAFATIGNDGVHPTPAANALVTVPAVVAALSA